MSCRTGAIGVFFAALTWVQAPAETVSFQNGVNGYEGALEIRVNDDVRTLNLRGSSSQNYFLDGDQSDYSEINYWDLIRFDDIIGLLPGQVPPGATITSARLELTTSTVSNAQSPGPWGVTRLLRSFDAQSGWNTVFGEDGVPDATDIERPAGGYVALTVGTMSSADITPIVQAWSDGAPNNGVVIIAGTSDGWSIQTTGNNDPAVRPRLVIDYIPARSRAIILQQGAHDYAGTSMIYLRMDGTTMPGTDLVSEYLDLRGASGDTTNTAHALLKFGGVFGSDPNIVPAAAEILRAYVVIRTSPRTESFQTRSTGPFNARALLSEFNWALADDAPGLRYWSDFGVDGPMASDLVGPVVSSCVGMVWDSQAWFEVTDLLKGWQAGEANNGLIIEAATTDGWKINWLKEGAVPPQLVVRVASRPADINGDTHVDGADMEWFAACVSGPTVPYALECAKADLDSDRDVDQADFAVMQRCYSGPTNLAVPECR